MAPHRRGAKGRRDLIEDQHKLEDSAPPLRPLRLCGETYLQTLTNTMTSQVERPEIEIYSWRPQARQIRTLRGEQ